MFAVQILCTAHGGALYGKREHLARLRRYKMRPASDDIPDRWQTGTKSHDGLAGVTAAIEYLAELGQRIKPATSRRAALVQAMEAIRAYEHGL